MSGLETLLNSVGYVGKGFLRCLVIKAFRRLLSEALRFKSPSPQVFLHPGPFVNDRPWYAALCLGATNHQP